MPWSIILEVNFGSSSSRKQLNPSTNMSKLFAIVLVFATICLLWATAAPTQILDAQTAINKIIGKLLFASESALP